MINLRDLISPDWFEEIKEKPQTELEHIDYGIYLSECEYLGNMHMTLFLGEYDNSYYMQVQIKEPIGDYGIRDVFTWYKAYDEYKSQIDEIIENIG